MLAKRRKAEPVPQKIVEAESAAAAATVLATASTSATTADIEPPTGKKRRKNLILTEELELNLADWLRCHPEIYSKRLPAFKDIAKKERLWEKKAAELQLESVTMLKTWYNSIRTRIGKLGKTKSEAPAKELTERDLFLRSSFGFLSEHIARKRGQTACRVSVRVCVCVCLCVCVNNIAQKVFNQSTLYLVGAFPMTQG